MNIVEFSKLAGLSTATVSRAFHEPDKLRPKTRDRVLSLAAKHGYYPNASARALVQGKHDTIGLVWPLEVEGTGSIFAQRVLAGFARQLVANDLDLLLCPVDRRQPATLDHARRTLQRSRCDAWVLLYPRGNDPLIPLLHATRKPIICLMGAIPGTAGWKSVTLDQNAWIDDALLRLRKSGSRRVLFLGCREGEPDHQERLAAFNSLAPGHFKRNFLSHPVWPLDITSVAALLRKEKVDAVIGVDDTAALAALAACKQARIRVPANTRIIGMDDTPEARRSIPTLATFRQPLDEMTACAVELAMNRRSTSRKFKAVFVPGETLGTVHESSRDRREKRDALS